MKLSMSYLLVYFLFSCKELKNSVNATIQISVNTPELATKILKTSEVKDFDISEELERLTSPLFLVLRFFSIKVNAVSIVLCLQ